MFVLQAVALKLNSSPLHINYLQFLNLDTCVVQGQAEASAVAVAAVTFDSKGYGTKHLFVLSVLSLLIFYYPKMHYRINSIDFRFAHYFSLAFFKGTFIRF